MRRESVTRFLIQWAGIIACQAAFVGWPCFMRCRSHKFKTCPVVGGRWSWRVHFLLSSRLFLAFFRPNFGPSLCFFWPLFLFKSMLLDSHLLFLLLSKEDWVQNEFLLQIQYMRVGCTQSYSYRRRLFSLLKPRSLTMRKSRATCTSIRASVIQNQ